MIRRIAPGERCGCVKIPASNSQAHRLRIFAALGERETRLICNGISKDIAATLACLKALGSGIREEDGALLVRPIWEVPAGECRLPCGESGSTLRFLLPVVGALGAKAVFVREGRLPERPLAPLDRELTAHGMTLERDGALLRCGGQLLPGAYTLPGNVSSQYISGLLLALPRLNGESRLTVTGTLESSAYVTMTEDALRLAGVAIDKHNLVYVISGPQRGRLPEMLRVEGDWSNAAFFLSIGALSSNGMKVMGLARDSSQGDRSVLEILRGFGAEIAEDGESILVRRGALRGQTIDAAPIPDLIPVLSVVAAVAEGETRVINAGRLRLKESDRLRSTTAMLHALGAAIEELPEGLVIHGRPRLDGGTVDAAGDHRIAMAAAVAATVCAAEVTINGAECVAKSYPRFWSDFDALSGGEV
jgi:3-phosphoshikimate 1-carboxyvinyltransferase